MPSTSRQDEDSRSITPTPVIVNVQAPSTSRQSTSAETSRESTQNRHKSAITVDAQLPEPPASLLTSRRAVRERESWSSSATSTTDQPCIPDVFAGRAPSASISLDDFDMEKTAAEQLADELDAIRICSESITPTATLTRPTEREDVVRKAVPAPPSVTTRKSVTIIEAVPIASTSRGHTKVRYPLNQ